MVGGLWMTTVSFGAQFADATAAIDGAVPNDLADRRVFLPKLPVVALGPVNACDAMRMSWIFEAGKKHRI